MRSIVSLPRAEGEKMKETEKSGSSFLSTVESLSGQKLRNCYQCKKCSVGCPVAYAADYKVNQIVRLVQMNRVSDALQSSMIWICAACETCGARCPNDINMAPVMDVLKQMALQEEGCEIKETKTSVFHSVFLNNVKSNGRIHEGSMMGKLKLKTGGIFSDMDIALDMLKKGKLRILPEKIKGRKQLKKIFEEEKDRIN